jgi:hypothetical protein
MDLLHLLHFLDLSWLVWDEAQKTMHKVLCSDKYYKVSNTHNLHAHVPCPLFFFHALTLFVHDPLLN